MMGSDFEKDPSCDVFVEPDFINCWANQTIANHVSKSSSPKLSSVQSSQKNDGLNESSMDEPTNEDLFAIGEQEWKERTPLHSRIFLVSPDVRGLSRSQIAFLTSHKVESIRKDYLSICLLRSGENQESVTIGLDRVEALLDSRNPRDIFVAVWKSIVEALGPAPGASPGSSSDLPSVIS